MPEGCRGCASARVRTPVGQLRVSRNVKLVVQLIKERLNLRSEHDAFELLINILAELLRHKAVRAYIKHRFPDVGRYIMDDLQLDMYSLKVEFSRVHIYGLGHLLSKVCEVTLYDFILLMQMWADEHVKMLNTLERIGKTCGKSYLISYTEAELPYAEKILRDCSTFAKVLYYGAPCRTGIWTVVDERSFHGEKTILKIKCEICGHELETTDPWRVYEHFCVEEWEKIKKCLGDLSV